MIHELYRKLYFSDFGDERGKLVVAEGDIDIPFAIQRVFYIYGSDDSVVRGQHANRNSQFVLINVAGSSKVTLTDGVNRETVTLSRPMEGLYIPKMVWKEMYDFSSDSVLLVLASTHYDESEYIRDYEEYAAMMRT
ncbi:MAG: FdtA/QdtA family cupin domain-containing protein [Lachnospiraceae bacterium]|nr:FdtA/QdtA family cupin domain-containing protein [Lachnospiraceae bacterium]